MAFFKVSIVWILLKTLVLATFASDRSTMTTVTLAHALMVKNIHTVYALLVHDFTYNRRLSVKSQEA